MSVASEKNNRIAKNTLFLYLRMLLIMAVTLYTSRVVLEVLGVEDFGIYMAVGGFVAMFSVISNSLSASISRFLTFELGRGDKDKVKRIFSTAVLIQCLIGGIIFLLTETFGGWFLNTQMTIPEDRLVAANWVFHFSLLTFVVNLISVPYNACIIAHERMSAFAYIGFVDAIGRLVVTFMISSIAFDHLILYAILMCFVALFVRFLYRWYCKRHFEECYFQWVLDRSLLGDMFGFAGWNFIGASSSVLRDQGINVLLNVFCGPTVNAARGIAMQVSTAITSFSSNFQAALNPQITKSYAAGDLEYVKNLIFKGARLSFYLLLLVSLPILIETKTILSLWLNVVPIHSVLFVRLIILYVMTESVSCTMITLMLATGRIRSYQLIVGGGQMMNFPLAYILLKWGYAPEFTMVGSILISILCLFLRLYMLHNMVGLPIMEFIQKVLLNVIGVCLLALLLPLCLSNCMGESWFRFLLNCVVCVFSTILVIYYVGCSRDERLLILLKFRQFVNKINR